METTEEKATVSGTASADFVDVTLLPPLAALALLFGRRIHLKVGIASKLSCRIFFVWNVKKRRIGYWALLPVRRNRKSVLLTAMALRDLLSVFGPPNSSHEEREERGVRRFSSV